MRDIEQAPRLLHRIDPHPHPFSRLREKGVRPTRIRDILSALWLMDAPRRTRKKEGALARPRIYLNDFFILPDRASR